MAEKPISHDEIFEDKVLQPTIDQFNELNRVLALTETGLKKIAASLGDKVRAGVDPKTISEVEALKAALEKLKQTEAGISEVKRAQIAAREAEKKQIRQIRDELKAQGGILGELIIKKKQLQDGLLSAKTKDEIKKINEELFKTNGQIKNIKEGGTNAFNTWGNALQSFQFKFNSLGATLGQMAATGLMGLLGVMADFGKEALKAGVEWAKSVGLFGESVRQAKENTAALEGELKGVEDRLNSISKGLDVQFSSAFDSVLQTIDLKIAKTQETLDNFNPKLKGLSAEDLLKVSEERKKIEDELAALQIERRIAVENQYRESLKRETEAVKKENIERIQDQIAKLGLENRINLERQADQEITVQEFKSRKADIDRQIEELEKLSLERQGKRQVEANEKKKKLADEAVKIREESLKREFDAFIKYWDKVDAEDAQRMRDLWKAAQDEADRLRGIDDDKLEDQRRAQKKADDELWEAALKEADRLQKVDDDALEEKRKKAKAAAEKRLKDEQEMAEKLNKAIFDGLEIRNQKEQKLNEQKLTELDKQIEFQQELALNGQANTLSELQKQRAEALEEQARLERQAAKEKEAEQLAEVFLEFMKVYAKDGLSGAAKATAATIAAKGLSKLIAGNFAEGVEDFKGKGTGTSDSNLIGFSNGESVVTAKGTDETAGLVTAVNKKGFDGAAEWAMKYVFPKVPVLADKSMSEQVNNSVNKLLLNEVRKMNENLANIPDVDFKRNVFNELVSIERKQGIINETTIKTVPPSYKKR